MSSTKIRTIDPASIKRGMRVRATVTWQSGVTQVTEGPVSSTGNGRTLLLGDVDHYAEVAIQRPDATTEWGEVIELPEGYGSVVLVLQPDGKLQAMTRTSPDEWHHVNARWTNSEVLAQLDRVLWEGEQ